MVYFTKVLLTGSALLVSNMLTTAKPVDQVGKAWEWMWGNPPQSDYITSSSHACSPAGNVFNQVNAAAKHIASVQIFSDKGAINGLKITYVDGLSASHGKLSGKGSKVLRVPVDKFIWDVKMGCTGDVVSYLSIGTNAGKSIEVGSAEQKFDWGGKGAAAFEFTGSANDAGFVSFGAQFSEPEQPEDEQ